MVELYLFFVVGRFGVSAFSYYCSHFSYATIASVRSRSAAGRIIGDSLFSYLLSASLSTVVYRLYRSSDLVLVGLSGWVTWL